MVVFALMGCLKPNAAATSPPAPIVPPHCLDYTGLEDGVYPDTLFALANCSELLPDGAAVALLPIAPFNADDMEAANNANYVADLSGTLMQVSKPAAGQTPTVGYEYAQPADKQIGYEQLITIEQNLHYIANGLKPEITVWGAATPLNAGGAVSAPNAAAIDLEKLTENMALAVQWYETIRPLLANIAAQSASEADNAVIQVLDLTLKPLAGTVKEVNGLVANIKSGATPDQKAQYTTDAALRIQQSTAALQTYIWTLVYKKIQTP